ncbi:MAG TPA: hypothetical protein VK442_06505 [Xanthobacteraceae bacterium]|nr:hypothetical protein [Xanthobacteraceae bacterium]
MALTLLMFFVLIVSFALMFALVEFTDNVIAERQYEAAGDGAAAATEEIAGSL